MQKGNFIVGVILLMIFCLGCKGESNNVRVGNESESSLENSIKENDTIQISGILICTHCYALNNKNIGLNHHLPESGYIDNCAKLCAEQNYPIGIFTNLKQFNSNVWVIRTSSQLFTDYMSNEARIMGLYIKDALIEPIHIEVEDGNKWISLQ